jgi:hypothetical protein
MSETNIIVRLGIECHETFESGIQILGAKTNIKHKETMKKISSFYNDLGWSTELSKLNNELILKGKNLKLN